METVNYDVTYNKLNIPYKKDYFRKTVIAAVNTFSLVGDKVMTDILKRNGIEAGSIRELYNKLYVNELSGACNRRFLNEKISKEIERADIRGEDVCIAYFDGDNLKYINDNYGHDKGDHEIVFLSQTIARYFNTRHQGAKINPARLGKNIRLVHVSGDEFMIFVYNSSSQEVIEKLKLIKTDISKEALKRKKENINAKLNKDEDVMMPPPISFTCAVVNMKKGENLEQIRNRVEKILNRIKSSDRGSIYMDDIKVWGNDFQLGMKQEELTKVIKENLGKDCYAVIAEYQFSDAAIDRSNKVNSHTLNAISQMGSILVERIQECKCVYSINDNKSLIILKNINLMQTQKLTKAISEIISLDTDLKNKVYYNLGGQEIKEDYSVEQILNSAEEKLRMAQAIGKESIIDRRIIIQD